MTKAPDAPGAPCTAPYSVRSPRSKTTASEFACDYVHRRPSAAPRTPLSGADRRQPRRDERPGLAPARVSLAARYPGIIGGLDELAGGTWLAANQSGLVAAMLNRPDSLGPEAGKKSRGELPLMALEADDLASAAERIAAIDGRVYRSFNMVIAGPDGALWIRFSGDEADGHPSVQAIPRRPAHADGL